MEKMTQKEAYKMTEDLCLKYGIRLSAVRTRNKKGTWGTAFMRTGKIVYSLMLFEESRCKVIETVCHEVAHLLAAKRYGKNCKHNHLFHICEIEIGALYGIRPVYLRNRGYAAAYQDTATGWIMDCRPGYKVENGQVVIDRDKKAKDRILHKVMKAALKARAFNKYDRFSAMTCEPMKGYLALTVGVCNDKVQNGKKVIYQSEVLSDDFKAGLKDVKYTGRLLRYNIISEKSE